MRETEEARPFASKGDDEDRDYTVPILAEDEVAKEVGAEHLMPAVSPRYDRRGSQYEDQYRGGDATPTSRPASRPGSIYGLHSASQSLHRFTSHQDDRENTHTPLEDVREYEPLFPEDDQEKKKTPLDRFKSRPDALKHRFPSQDIWEDTPDSAMYQATVSTPEPEEPKKESDGEPKASTTFEAPETEAARKEEVSEEERRKLIPKEVRLAKSLNAPHLRDDMPTRPGMEPRFPSQDIWEDTPDHSQLVTTVSTPPPVDDDEGEEESSPVEPRKPTIPSRPAKSRLGEGASSAQIAPSVPPRPVKDVDTPPKKEESSPTELRKVPSLPDRPKPQVPSRPAKKPSIEGLNKTLSGGSDGGEQAAKSKPPVPARPQGKIGALQPNFMADLNKKLGLDPPKEKKAPDPEAQEEVKPLEDARKGRARGPQRRAPAKSPAAEPKPSPLRFAMAPPQSMWSIDEEGSLNVKARGKDEGVSKNVDTVTPADAPSDSPSDLPADDMSGEVEHTDQGQDLPSAATREKEESFETTKAKAAQMPRSLAAPLARNIAGEYPDPTFALESPGEERSNPMSHQPSIENLSKQTTATDSTGPALEREDQDPSTDAIPVSKSTTAEESEKSGAPLERSETRASDEPIKVRNEQVSAPAPGINAPSKERFSSIAGSGGAAPYVDRAAAEDIRSGADSAKEPAPENDVSYKKLEQMTAMADGKHNAEEGATTKVIE